VDKVVFISNSVLAIDISCAFKRGFGSDRLSVLVNLVVNIDCLQWANHVEVISLHLRLSLAGLAPSVIWFDWDGSAGVLALTSRFVRSHSRLLGVLHAALLWESRLMVFGVWRDEVDHSRLLSMLSQNCGCVLSTMWKLSLNFSAFCAACTDWRNWWEIGVIIAIRTAHELVAWFFVRLIVSWVAIVAAAFFPTLFNHLLALVEVSVTHMTVLAILLRVYLSEVVDSLTGREAREWPHAVAWSNTSLVLSCLSRWCKDVLWFELSRAAAICLLYDLMTLPGWIELSNGRLSALGGTFASRVHRLLMKVYNFVVSWALHFSGSQINRWASMHRVSRPWLTHCLVTNGSRPHWGMCENASIAGQGQSGLFHLVTKGFLGVVD